jgi:hypothetical protein
MVDRGVIVLTAAACLAMAVVLALALGMHIEPYYYVSQHDLVVPDDNVSECMLPEIVPGGQATVPVWEALEVMPYDRASGATQWRFVRDGPDASWVEYRCYLNYSAGYTLNLFGSPVFSGIVPGSARSWLIINATAPANRSGQWNAVHMPENVRLPASAGNLPAYSS